MDKGMGMLPFQAPLHGLALALGLDKRHGPSFNSSVTPTVLKHSSGHMYAQKIFIE